MLKALANELRRLGRKRRERFLVNADNFEPFDDPLLRRIGLNHCPDTDISQMVSPVGLVEPIWPQPVEPANQLIDSVGIPRRAVEHDVASEIVEIQARLDPLANQQNLRCTG